ncbi:MAG: hemerythrin domain-containing protein [Proteobacteria bacterium]|nr:hemerythrin domain-containing protein [Pseudomonadota bacterium]MBU1709588.1 hemerythrin domain-containing protein [Pseudomonadota bacterium]
MANLWRDEYRLNLKIIDDQHKGFFELNDSLSQLLEKSEQGKVNLPKIIKVILEFRAYALYHFHTEEKLMLANSYPGFFDHINQHNEYVRKILDMEEDIFKTYHEININYLDPKILADKARGINEYIVNWYVKHIMQADKQYADHMSKKMARKK